MLNCVFKFSNFLNSSISFNFYQYWFQLSSHLTLFPHSKIANSPELRIRFNNCSHCGFFRPITSRNWSCCWGMVAFIVVPSLQRLLSSAEQVNAIGGEIWVSASINIDGFVQLISLAVHGSTCGKIFCQFAKVPHAGVVSLRAVFKSTRQIDHEEIITKYAWSEINHRAF